MNEIEMAIDAIGTALAQEPPAAIEQGYGFYLVIEDALATAHNALREKAEREKGCEYCLQGEDLAYGLDSMQRTGRIYIDGNLLTADLYSESMAVAVCCCPMCGRELGKRLEVEHDG